MKYFKKLVGDRLYLSPKGVEDVEKYTIWLNDFETTDYTGRSSASVNIEQERKFLEDHINEEASFGIVDLKTDELVGTIGLHQVDHLNRIATLGIFIGEKDFRDKGYGTEAIKLILDFGFNYLNLKNIDLDVMAFNERAIKCYNKCGFKEIGRRRQCKYINGKYHDVISMDILKEEFEGEYIRNKNI